MASPCNFMKESKQKQTSGVLIEVFFVCLVCCHSIIISLCHFLCLICVVDCGCNLFITGLY